MPPTDGNRFPVPAIEAGLAEVAWRSAAGREIEAPNPYSNFYDIMSGLNLSSILGWSYDLPSTLAINRYSAGWIEPEGIALHLDDSATYTLSKPFRRSTTGTTRIS